LNTATAAIWRRAARPVIARHCLFSTGWQASPCCASQLLADLSVWMLMRP